MKASNVEELQNINHDPYFFRTYVRVFPKLIFKI